MANENIPEGLTEEEIMLYLSTIIYSDAFIDENTELPYEDGSISVYKAVNDWEPPIVYEKDKNGNDTTTEAEGNAAMYQAEWQQVKDSILAHPEIFDNMTLQNINDNDPLDRSAAITDKDGNLIIVYRGTAGGEWPDNGTGAYSNVTDTIQQQKALDYYNQMKELYGDDAVDIFVTGHSKGGNKTMYVTTLGEGVTHGYAFDGQGFNSAFLAKYMQEIMENKDKITNISNKYDFVNILMYSIAGNKVFTDSSAANNLGDFARYHSPYSLMTDENGHLSLLPVEGVKQDPGMELVGRFLCYLADTMPEDEFQDLVYNLMLTMTDEDVRKELGLPDPDIGAKKIATLVFYLNEFVLNNNISPEELAALLQAVLNLLPTLGKAIIAAIVIIFPDLLILPAELIRYSVGNSSNLRVRDFTEETKQKLLDLVNELEEEKACWKFWTWDVFDRVGNLFGQLTPEKYLEDMNSYYKKLIDINDASKEKIEQIFQNVEEVDSSSTTKINQRKEELSNIISNLNTFNSKFT